MLEEAFPGGLIAIGVTLDPFITKSDQMRGQVAGKPGTMPETTTEILMEFHVLERLLTNTSEQVKMHELLILTIGTSTLIGTVVRQKPKELELLLKMPAIVEQGQRIAVSKKIGNAWRLYAYGIAK